MKSLRAWDHLVDPVNVWGAWTDFQRGKRRRPEVARFDLEADRHVLRLARDLQAGRWRTQGYRVLRIVDPKRRIIAAAPVADRVVHHALHRVVAPWWNRSFIDHSYACLSGRGSQRAVLRYREGLRRFPYVLHLDVARYFYSIDQEILSEILFRRLPEPRMRLLISWILRSAEGLYQREDVWRWLGWDGPGPVGVGLPIGNLTSQWWGNVYLDGLDHFLCRELKVPLMQRYMDDVTLFGSDRGQLLSVRDAISEWLGRERRLVLKDPEARPKRCDRAHLYLGYRVSRPGIEIGPKARARVPRNLGRVARSPRRLRASVASIAAGWMFGSG